MTLVAILLACSFPAWLVCLIVARIAASFVETWWDSDAVGRFVVLTSYLCVMGSFLGVLWLVLAKLNGGAS